MPQMLPLLVLHLRPPPPGDTPYALEPRPPAPRQVFREMPKCSVSVPLWEGSVLYNHVWPWGLIGAAGEVYRLQLAEPCPGAPQDLAFKAARVRVSDLEAEVITLEQLQPHPNIIQLYGPCTCPMPYHSPREGIVLEYCSYGDAGVYCGTLVQQARDAAANTRSAAGGSSGVSNSGAPSSSQGLHGQGRQPGHSSNTRRAASPQTSSSSSSSLMLTLKPRCAWPPWSRSCGCSLQTC
jgi:hypothetical protein